MTSNPDPKGRTGSGRDLGPPLAIAGGALALVAVIAGFIVIGGPGDARERRLDEMTLGNLRSLAAEARCAFHRTAKTYETVAEIKAVADRIGDSDDVPGSMCWQVEPDVPPEGVTINGNPARPGDLDYTRLDDGRIRLCGVFRREERAERARPPYRGPSDAFREFDAPHPAGKHCYDLTLPQESKEKPEPAEAIVSPN